VPFFTSLSARLITWTLVTALTTFSMLLLLVLYQVNKGLSQQTDQISHWSEERLAQRLTSDALLARARINTLYDDVSTRFASLAQRSDVSKAIQSRNSVAISELLASALALADLDGVLVLDEKSRVLGADRLDADILRAHKVLRSHPILRDIQQALRNDTPHRRIRITGRFDRSFAEALAANWTAPLAGVFIEPVLDDFGGVTAVIVGYRQLHNEEVTLAEFSRLTERSVFIISDGNLISRAGPAIFSSGDDQRGSSGLVFLDQGRSVARCVGLWNEADVCAVAPSSELEHLATQVIAIGEEQTNALIWWLVGAVAVALLLFALMSFVVSRHITLPLREITSVVGDVAEGNWRVFVPGLARRDEVGNIARAVTLLARSVEERDKLRTDVVAQNATLLQKEETLREQNLFFDAALNNMSQGLCMFDEAHQLTVVNKHFFDIYRLDADRLRANATAQKVLELSLGLNCPPEYFSKKLHEHVAIVQERQPVDYSLELTDGRTVAISHRPMTNGGWVETHEDVTERKAAEAKVAYLARHDSLTRLSNRVLFQERLNEAIQGCVGEDACFAVLCLDLDGFKVVNDTLGHSAGDELLRQMAQRLLSVVGQTDTVARLGGDEFAIIDMAQDQPASAEAMAVRLKDALKRPFTIFGQSVPCGVSIGVALGTAAIDPDHLLRNADLALYLAKGAGRGTCRLFKPEMHLQMEYRQRLERDLREAIAKGQLDVHFQPMIHLGKNEISGFEALVRWNHPERGMVSPGEFIPLAEEVGLIDKLGEIVLLQACKEAASWPSSIKLSVNISPVQFRARTLIDAVTDALSASKLPAERLELEVTESVILHDDSETLSALRELRELGIRISMDDFGTGYSSLSGLRSFPFDKIKLDRSFVRDALVRPDCATIVRAVADLGKNLGMATTAEGVETIEQLENVRRHGYTEAQGFVFSPAVQAWQARQMIKQQRDLLQKVA
jgi:diguanylate cyclase (GGDEF)-like protein